MNRANGASANGRNGRPKRSSFESLKVALDAHVQWPTTYVFKFIVPAAELNHLLALLDPLPYSTRESRTGRYVSVTSEVEMESSEHVIAVYRRMSAVKGLMSL